MARGWGRVAGAVTRRPALWATAARHARRLAPSRWWRHPPFLPVPDASWLRFRSETQYGGDGRAPIEPVDVGAWLAWAQATDHRNRTARSRLRR